MFNVKTTIFISNEERETVLSDQVLEAMKTQRIESCHNMMMTTFGPIVGTNKFSCVYSETNGYKFNMTAVAEILPSGSLMVMIGDDT